jgi:hypothetical protein
VTNNIFTFKENIHKEYKIIINIYIPNDEALNFINYTLLDIKGEIAPNITIVGNFNILFSPIETIKTTKKQQWPEFNKTIDHMLLTYIYIVLHPTVAGYTLFS